MIKKSPIILTDERILSLQYYYRKDNPILIELKGNARKPKLEEGTEYWLPESYRIVNECIQYRADIYQKTEPEWIDAKKMTQNLCRMHFIVKCAKEVKATDLDKTNAIQLSVPEKHLNYDSGEKPKNFKGGEMMWRLKHYLEKTLNDKVWENNDSLFLYEIELHRKKPNKYPNYLDKYRFESLK